MTTNELLEKFIDTSTMEDNVEKLIFLQDIILCQGLIAWKNLKVTFADVEIDCNDINDESWETLWEFSEFEVEDFATLIGKKYSEAEDVLKRLIFLKYIYPDGRVDKVASAYAKNISKSMMAKILSQSKLKGEKSDGRKNKEIQD